MWTLKNIGMAAALVLASCAACAADVWAPPQKKIIAYSWDIGSVPEPERMQEHADLLDMTGLDGIVVPLPMAKCPDGKMRRLSWEAMSSDFVTEEMLGPYVLPYKNMTSRHKAFKESFLGCSWSPLATNRLVWTDDAAWAKFTANMKEVSSLARRAGFVGVQVDPEDYGKKRQFSWAFDDPPQVETLRIARARGRQIGKAMFDEFPSMKLLSFWLLSLDKSYARSSDAAATMRGCGDLWPMFVNGLLDVAPAGVVFIDGDEHAYDYRAGRHDFTESNLRQLTSGLALIAPENRAKWRTQARVGFGLWLDQYTWPEDREGACLAKSGSRLEALRENLKEALHASDEYVWLFGCRQRWVKWRDFRPVCAYMKIGEETWEEKLPGLSKMLCEVKNPKVEINARLAEFRSSGARNLLKQALNKNSSKWQDKSSCGTFKTMPGKGTDSGTLLSAEGVSYGCFLLKLGDVKPGDVFYAEAFVRGNGAGGAWLRWEKAGKTQQSAECVNEAFGEPDAYGWRRMVAKTPPAPEGMTGLSLKIFVKQKPGEKVELDRAAVFKSDSAR